MNTKSNNKNLTFLVNSSSLYMPSIKMKKKNILVPCLNPESTGHGFLSGTVGGCTGPLFGGADAGRGGGISATWF